MIVDNIKTKIQSFLKRKHPECSLKVLSNRPDNSGDFIINIILTKAPFHALSSPSDWNRYIIINTVDKYITRTYADNLLIISGYKNSNITLDALNIFRSILAYIKKELVKADPDHQVQYVLSVDKKFVNTKPPDVDQNISKYSSKRKLRTLEGNIIEGILKSV